MGVNDPDKVTDDDIIAACKKANCHMFISQMPNGYQYDGWRTRRYTFGGQKQPIAIARAIPRTPHFVVGRSKEKTLWVAMNLMSCLGYVGA